MNRYLKRQILRNILTFFSVDVESQSMEQQNFDNRKWNEGKVNKWKKKKFTIRNLFYSLNFILKKFKNPLQPWEETESSCQWPEYTRLRLALLLPPPFIPLPCLSGAGLIGTEQVFLLEKGYVILPHPKEQEGNGESARQWRAALAHAPNGL